MEQFKLFEKNGVHYIEKDNLKIILSYSHPFSVFSDKYFPIQINNKPIIDDKKSPMDKITKSIEDIMPSGMKLPFDSLQDGLKAMLEDNSMLDMLKKMGMDSNMVDNLKNVNLDDDKLLGNFLEIYSKRAETTFNLILGKDILDTFIVLIDYNNSEVIFFSSKEEVGKRIGTTYHINNLISNHFYLIPDLLTINGHKCSVTLSSSLKNIFATKDVFNKIMNNMTTIPATKIETDFLGEMGTVNETFFKFDIESTHLKTEGWIAKLPDMANSMFQGVSNIDLIIPLSFFSNGVLIDGINKKFGYKKD